MNYGTITEQEISDAKLRYGKVQVLTIVVSEDITEDEKDADGKEVKDADGNVQKIITTPGEKYNVLVRRPDKSTMKMLTSIAASGDNDKFFDCARKNLVVEGVGDLDALDSDGIVYMGFITEINNLISPAKAFLQPV